MIESLIIWCGLSVAFAVLIGMCIATMGDD